MGPLDQYNAWVAQNFGDRSTLVGTAAFIGIPAVIGWMLGFPKTGALLGVGLSYLAEQRYNGQPR